MPALEANSVDTIITDPPYGLSFMGKDWDHGVPGVAFWQAALRVAKPGAMLLAFGGTRTFHRLTCAIEDAGWEVRDVIAWLHGQGFPKGHDISKALDKRAGAERETLGEHRPETRVAYGNGAGALRCSICGNSRNGTSCNCALPAPATDAAQTWHGWNVALKPAWEPVILAMKPLDGTFADNAQRWGVAGLNVDGARIAGDYFTRDRDTDGGASMFGTSKGGGAFAPTAGRWPANLLLDEDAAAALDAQAGPSVPRPVKPENIGVSGNGRRMGQENGIGYAMGSTVQSGYYDNTANVSRFFYVAKASRRDRGEGNIHPTCKPTELMRYLCRLTSTPYGGVVLDPFMGSGTTGVACAMEGRNFIGVELDAGYFDIARRRIESVQPALMEAAD